MKLLNKIKTLQAKSNILMNREKLTRTRKNHTKGELRKLTELLPVKKNNGFQLKNVSFNDIKYCLKLLRNNYYNGQENVPIMFVKHTKKFLVLPLHTRH